MGERVCPVQMHPLEFFSLLKWIDQRPLLDVIPPFWQAIIVEALYTIRPDGSPQFNRVLWGMAKKNMKTLMLILSGLYKLCAWQAAGNKGNQCYLIASDLGQADDDLDLTKKIIRCNPVLADELIIMANVIERKDALGFIEILPGQNVATLHGKTFLWKGTDELHTQRTYNQLEALELDRTRPDAVACFASYASVSQTPGQPLNDMLKQHTAKTDPRLFVAWYAGTIDEANPALNTPLGPTRQSILDAELSLPSWIFRRLCLNLPGAPDGAAFDANKIEDAIVKGRMVLPPQPGIAYVAFCDLSGGGADDATLAIAHSQEGVGVLDLVIDQGARTHRTFSPEETVRKFADTMKQYGCSTVEGDRYAAQWPILAFEKHGITYRPALLTRSQIYTGFEPLLNSGQVQLLDQPKLFSQLIGLVRKGEKIDHTNGEHDDHSNSCAGVLVLVSRSSGLPWMFFSGGRMLSSVSDAVSSVVQSISTRLTATGKALTSPVRQVFEEEPQCFPRPGGGKRTIEELENLDVGCRSPEEQARLDAHHEQVEKRQQRRAARDVEALQRAGGCWFPTDDRPRSGFDDVLDDIQRTFSRWR